MLEEYWVPGHVVRHVPRWLLLDKFKTLVPELSD